MLISSALDLPSHIDVISLQPPSLVAELFRKGIISWSSIVTDPSVVSPEMISAYGWMSRAMIRHQRSGRASGILWCWYRSEILNQYRKVSRDPKVPGEHSAMLFLRLPVERVLLSWFQPWEQALTGAPIARDKAKLEYYDMLSCREALTQDIIDDSWEEVLLGASWPEDVYGAETSGWIQGAMSEIRVGDLHNIVAVEQVTSEHTSPPESDVQPD